MVNIPFLGALAGCSARRSERRVASHTSEEQRRNAPGSAAKNGILAFSVSLTALAELFTRQIAENLEATGMNENSNAAKARGRIARQARQQLENQTGKSEVSGENYLAPRAVKGVLKPSPRKKQAGIGWRGAASAASAAIGVK